MQVYDPGVHEDELSALPTGGGQGHGPLPIYPAGGCMANYAVMDTFHHIHLPVIGSVLDTENFRSWSLVDGFVKNHIPAMDKKSVAIIGDGQKGELKSHKTMFRHALLRACYRHRRADLIRDRSAGQVSLP